MSTVWLPDWPPETPSAYDDEFSDASLDAGLWTEFDPGGALTITEGNYGLRLERSAANDKINGVFQAVPPSGDWTIWTKATLIGIDSDRVGLLLGADLTNNPTTSDVAVLHIYFAPGVSRVGAIRWDDYNATSGSDLASISDDILRSCQYLRIRKASTTYGFDWSHDGIGWQQIYSNTLSFTPAEFGLYVQGVSAIGILPFFRCTLGTPAITDVALGRRIDLESPPFIPIALFSSSVPSAYNWLPIPPGYF